MRKVASLAGLAVVLAVAYWFDLYVLPPMLRAAGYNFDPGPAIWTTMAAHIAIALATLGLVWMLFRWSPPSRLVGAVYLVVGFALAAAWPIAVVTGGANLPGFPELNLYLALQQPGGLLGLMAPFLTVIGLLRLVLPLPAGPRTARAHDQLASEPTALS